MAKTQEELKELKTEYETLNNKLKELSDDELKVVTGGLCEYKSLEKDTCFVKGECFRYVLVYDYPEIRWNTNFFVDRFAIKNGIWEFDGRDMIAQSELFSYTCIGKWRP